MIKNKGSRSITIFFSIITIINGIGFLLKKDYQLMSVVIITYLCYLLFVYLEKKYKYKVKNYIKVLIVTTIILNNVVGEYFNFYRRTKWFDMCLHAYGTFAFALFCYSILNSSLEFYSKSKMVTFIFITSIGMSIGVFFENIEFIVDLIFKTNSQGGIVDTNWDLILDAVGATIAGIFVIVRKNDF